MFPELHPPPVPGLGRALTGLLLPALLLAGCADMSGISPQAKLNAPAEVAAATLPDPATAAPRQGWWSALGDPQLERLVGQALAGNPGLRAAQARILEAKAVAGISEAATRPQLGAAASFDRERFTANQFFPPPYGGNIYWNNQAALSLSYELDPWGRQEQRVEAALGRARAIAAGAEEVALALSTAIVRAYVDLDGQYRQLDLAREQAGLIEEELALARRRQAAGLAPGQESDALLAALHRQQELIAALEGGLPLARHQLAALVGLGPAAGAAIERPRLAAPGSLALPAALPAERIGRRPDLRMLRALAEAGEHDIAAAKADFYPNIDLLAFAGLQALGFRQFFDGASAIGGVGPAISLPILDGGRRRNRLAADTAARDAAVEDYNAALLRSLQQVADQLSRIASNARQQDQTRAALDAATRRAASAERAHRAGLSPLPAVLAARAQVLQLRADQARLETARRDAYAALVQAAGGALDGGPAPEPHP